MQDDFNSELERRIAVFTRHLERMQVRAMAETRDNCFCIFDERSPGSEGRPAREVANAKRLVLADPSEPSQPGGVSEYDTWPSDGWRDDGDLGARRFVQFAFLPKYFMMDLPRNTLTRDEAFRLVRSRSGFFYLRDNPAMADSPTSSRQIRTYDPFCKAYLERDERRAAEDMAFVFFLLWHFPLDSKLYLTAFSGHRTGVQFEKGFPVE